MSTTDAERLREGRATRPMATHPPVIELNWHVWEHHVYSGDLPVDLVELAQFHAALHVSGLGHNDADEPTMAMLH